MTDRATPDRRTPAALDPGSLFGLGGSVAVVTGGTTGLGRACAEALARAGARVLIAGLPPTGPDRVAAQMRAAGLDVVGAAGDVTDPDHLAELVDTAVRRWGRLDTVLANAGVALDRTPDLDEPALDRMFDIHVRSVLRLADRALPVQAAGDGGAFLIMSSLSGLRGNRLLSGYSVTKAANAQIARNLAVQWGDRGIRANALAPGVIATEFARPITADPHAADARLARTPLRRFGDPAHVAGTVVWLASPAGAFVSGQTVVIDGGTLATD